jgi:hypothetical protein
MTLRTGEDTVIWRRKLQIALCGGIVLEEALDLSSERILNDMYGPLQTHQEVGKFSHLHYYVVCFCIFWFCFPLKSMEHFKCYLFTIPAWHFITLFPVPTLTFWPQGCTLLEDTIWNLRNIYRCIYDTIYLHMGFHKWQWLVNLYKNK